MSAATNCSRSTSSTTSSTAAANIPSEILHHDRIREEYNITVQGTKEKTATTDGHNYNKYDRNQSLVTSSVEPMI
jgi:hypothetical protein